MLFKTLAKLREYERWVLPFIQSQEDRDIIIEIGLAEEQGRALNLKQLGLLGLGSLATLRRRLTRLVDLGVLKREEHRNDGRIIVFRLNRRYLTRLKRFEADLKFMACQILAHETVMDNANNASLIAETKDPDAVVDILKSICAKHGKVKRVNLSCKEYPGQIFIMVELDGNAQAAADEIGGLVFGYTLICSTFPMPEGFRCADGPTKASCLAACPRAGDEK